jgi:hypothetical protein
MRLIHAWGRKPSCRGKKVSPRKWGKKEEVNMLWTLAIILIVLWLLGLVTATTLGGFIHVLLVIAVVVIIINLIRGRRVV